MQNPVNAPKRSAPTDAPTAIPTIAPVERPEDDFSSVIFATVVGLLAGSFVGLLAGSYVGGVVVFFDSCVELGVVVFVAFDVYFVGVTVVLPEVVILVGVVELAGVEVLV